MLYSPDLVGATLGVAVNGQIRRLRIDSLERDPADQRGEVPPGEAAWLHTFSVEGADGRRSNLCDAGPDGSRQGFVLAAHTSPDAMLHGAERGTLELICTAGSHDKCARVGYYPWGILPDGTPRLDTYYACVRMFRGDYTPGDPRIVNGTLIDAWNRHGITVPVNAAGMAFEAGWGPDGAVCVHHPRIAHEATLSELEEIRPELVGRTGEICTEDLARARGALVFNRSRP